MKDFILPDIGEGIVECELMEWLVGEGDMIEEDQPVAEVMTDKALVQIPAMYAGKVVKLYYQKGDIAKVHQPLFAMQPEGSESDESPTDAKNTEPDKQEKPSQSDETKTKSGNKQQSNQSSQQEDFILPDIGEGIVECELVEWLVSEGDMVREDQPVAEVMTDKALVQIPAKHDGLVVKLYYAKGDIAKVHTPLFAQKVDGHVESNDSASSDSKEKKKDTRQEVAPSDSKPVSQDTKATNNGKALASPAVRRLAREQDINIHQVPGSGKKGRVMKEDVAAFVKGDKTASSQQKQEVAPVTSGGTRTEVIRGVKAAMAKQMMDSVSTIPHFTVSDEIDMGNLIEARQQLRPQFEQQDIKLSFMPFIIKALSLALAEFPIINTQVNDDCSELTYFDDHNIGMAVDSKIGLLVPNIKSVQNLSLIDVAREVNRLIEQARAGRLVSADLKGGTVSISNVGVIGGTVATPVINKPEAAIVALGKMQKLPRFDQDEQVIAANIMHISWSGDHRIIDGATMVRFSNLWKSYLENPVSMLSVLK